MEIFPAIDLMDGKVVRLSKGKKESKKIYGEPLKYARKFEKYVDKVHIVDLDGSFSGEPKNLDTVKSIAQKTNLAIQMGGGIRDLSSLKEVLDIGVTYPVIGTKALDPSFRDRAVEITKELTASLDVKEGKIALKGWKKESSFSFQEAFERLRKVIGRFIYTAVSKDGALSGIEEVERFWDTEEVLYAGGVTDLEDLRKVSSTGFKGAIVGKSIYEGKLELSQIREEEIC